MFWFSHYGTAAFEPETAVEVPLLLLALVRALQET